MHGFDVVRGRVGGSNREATVTGEELGDALDLIEFREEIGWPPDRGPVMTEQPSPDELAEAERHLRVHLERAQGAEAFFLEPVRIVMAEYDRLKVENTELRELLAIRDEQVEENNAIIEAAYRVAASWSPHSTEEFDGDLVAALVREVQQ
jgi:hypothetical protein